MEKYMRWAVLVSAVMIPVMAVMAAMDIRRENIEIATQKPVTQGISDIDRQLNCMTRNVYYEAASEPAEGKLAVAQIVMNRVAHPDFPDTPCEVIHQRHSRTDRVVCQFSWLCDGSEQRHRIRQDLWDESRLAAKKVMLEGFRLPSLEHALYYHADYVSPRWRLDRVATIGRHIFYQPRVEDL